MEFSILDEKIEINRKHVITALVKFFIFSLFFVPLYILLKYEDFSSFYIFSEFINAIGNFLTLFSAFLLLLIAKKLNYDLKEKDMLSLAATTFLVSFLFNIIISPFFPPSSFFTTQELIFIHLNDIIFYLLFGLFNSAFLYMVLILMFNKQLNLSRVINSPPKILITCLAIALLPEIFDFFSYYLTDY